MNDKGVAVAQDVLDHLDALDVKLGVYMNGTIPTEVLLADRDKVLAAVQKNCQVCALGACIISKARVCPDVPLASLLEFVPEYDEDTDPERQVLPTETGITKVLNDVFSEKTMELFEAAFEVDPGHCESVKWEKNQSAVSSREVYGAVVFGSRYGNNRDRLKAIMTNIVANGGEFRPPLATYAELDAALLSFAAFLSMPRLSDPD